MLINAQYLNTDALTNYIAALEGGLRESGASRSTGNRGLGGSVGASVIKLQGNSESTTESTVTVRDHDASRLQRLIDAGHDAPDDLAWAEVLQPDVDFKELAIGSFVEWECDIYMPDSIATMSNWGEFNETVEAFKKLKPSAEALGLSMEGFPELDQLDSITSFMNEFDVAPVVVGDDSDTNWRIVGTLARKWISDSATLDDRVRIIGKVKKRVDKDRWYPIVSLPGMNLMGREARRRKEREGPKTPAEESQFLCGPLVVVDYLAIYS